jgi:valyl-tRNA synthetase
MVNWCPRCATVLSDLEVNHVEQSGLLWSIAYPLVDDGGTGGEVIVATTRPETMLGDTALAVHPQDERFKALVGRNVRLPIANRLLPIVADAFVDPKFGTGIVKITPAHDPNDFEAGKRHGLGSVTVIGFDGKMTPAAGEGFAHLDRFEARKKILKDLEAQGLRRGEKSHVTSIGRCQRCDTVLEPLVSLQWFVKIGPLAEKAIAATDRGDTRFTPDLWKKTYDEWMHNIRDWCISRQLWWGHQIPAWYCPDGHVTVPKPDEGDPVACGTCGRKDLGRDADVFDTWFSSWLMPFSALGWPAPTHDLAHYYPTTVLVTGFDILFFWVARMIMAGCWFTGKAPFADVVLHGLVRVDGEKMSKTKGNVIDPLVMCDEYGADAVRFSLAVVSGTGRDPSVGRARFESSRNFATKVWNAARFALGMLGVPGSASVDYARLGTVDRWILARLSETSGRVNASLEAFRFDEAANALYDFFWSEFCDGYLEMVKPVLRDEARPESAKAPTRAVLRRVLLDSLALLHPFMPFVSSEIRETLNGDGLKLAVTPFPAPNADWQDPLAVETVETLRAAATRIRNLRAERGLGPTEPLAAGLEVVPGPLADSLKEHASLLRHLARLESLEILEKGNTEGTSGKEDPRGISEKVNTEEIIGKPNTEGISEKGNTEGVFRDAIGPVGLVVALPARKLSDTDRAKLFREIAQLEGELEKIRARLADPSFVERAPSSVVEKTRTQLREQEERARRLRSNLEGGPR